MSTKDEAYEVILQIIAVVSNCRKWQQADVSNPERRCDLILPYLILILPTANTRKELVHVFTVSGFTISTDIRLSLEHGGYVRLLEQIHKSDIARNCQSDYIIYPSILAAMLHKTRADQEIMILYSVLASSIAWVDATMSLLVIESLAPTMSSTMHNSHSSRLTHKLHDVMVRLAITRPHFDPDVFIQQQSLLQANGATLADIAHGLTIDSIASTTRKSVSAAVAAAHASAFSSPMTPASPAIIGHRSSSNAVLPPPPPTRSREDSSERPTLISNVRSQDTMSMMSKHSSSPSLGSPESSFDRAMVPAHKEYLSRIGFGGLGRAIVFESNI
ncbi:hypothetical protein GGI21_006548, partial [Coemansia aciculifera]